MRSLNDSASILMACRTYSYLIRQGGVMYPAPFASWT